MSLALGIVGSSARLESQTTSSPYSFDKEITLDAWLLDKTGYVRSFAKAVLYGVDGRVYEEIIMGHQVTDLDYNLPVFNLRFVSPIGYANSSTRDLQVDDGHCYRAQVIAHSNIHSVHESVFAPSKCVPEAPEPVEVPKENCPILLDLNLDGFHLSGPDPAVSFDIDADGAADRIAWTKANSDDAFLCWDRNQNGTIDNGSELFGYATRLLSGGPAGIGYRALAELDVPENGGNADGIIDERDTIFDSLCVWNDRNRSGHSEAGEIRSVATAGLVSLSYRYRDTRMRDPFGNFFRYSARAEVRGPQGQVRPWLTYDVIFADAEP